MFESIVQLLDDYEQYRHNTSNVSARENIAIRMESVFVLLQQVIACTSPGNLECFSFIEAILQNILSLTSRGLRSSGLVRFQKIAANIESSRSLEAGNSNSDYSFSNESGPITEAKKLGANLSKPENAAMAREPKRKKILI